MEINGYAGKIIYIDLTTGEIRKEPLDPKMAEDYLGGWGFGNRLAYDIIPPDCDPLSPENAIIMGGGLFTGTPVPGSGEMTAVYKAPLTEGIATAAGGGHFGFMLKSSGFDQLVITGRSEKPVYIRVFNDGAEICDASHIWGKLDGYDTVDELRAKYEPCSVIPTCPAGENLVKISVTFIDKGGSLGWCGMPAVMGSKNLSAIVAEKGSAPIKVADPARLLKWVDKMLEKIMSYRHREKLISGGTFTMISPWIDVMGKITDNATNRDFTPPPFKGTDLDTINRSHRKMLACPGCPQGEKDRYDMPDAKCSPKIAYMTDFMIAPSWGAKTVEDSHDRAIFFDDKMNRLGVDLINFHPTRDLVVALQKQGLLPKEYDIGIEFSESDFDLNKKFINMIAYREGPLGDLMAEGAWRIAQKFGHGIEEQILQIKRSSPIIDGRLDSWNTMTMSNMVFPGRPHYAPGGIGIYMPGRTVDHHKWEAKRVGVKENDIDRIFDENGYNVGRLLKHAYDWYSFFNSFGQCHRLYIHRFHNIDGMVELYSAMTGIEISPAELLKKGERVFNMARIVNIRCGLNDRKYDSAPEKWFIPYKGSDGKDYPMMDYFGTKAITKEDTESALDDFYDESGLDKNGIPSMERLKELGQEWVQLSSPE